VLIRYSFIFFAAVNIFFAVGAAKANPASSHYQQLHAMLFSGVRTTALFTPGQCRLSPQAENPTPIPPVSGGFAIRDFMEVPGDSISFSDEHFTVRPDGVAVLELVQYRVMHTDAATVTVRSLSPLNYQPMSPPRQFQCVVGDGLRFASGMREDH
jgi:hypothetical protein